MPCHREPCAVHTVHWIHWFMDWKRFNFFSFHFVLFRDPQNKWTGIIKLTTISLTQNIFFSLFIQGEEVVCTGENKRQYAAGSAMNLHCYRFNVNEMCGKTFVFVCVQNHLTSNPLTNYIINWQCHSISFYFGSRVVLFFLSPFTPVSLSLPIPVSLLGRFGLLTSHDHVTDWISENHK